jgi:hypothetical protein
MMWPTDEKTVKKGKLTISILVVSSGASTRKNHTPNEISNQPLVLLSLP